MINRFIAAGFTASELGMIRARCLSYGGTDPIWEELESAWRITREIDSEKPLDSTS